MSKNDGGFSLTPVLAAVVVVAVILAVGITVYSNNHNKVARSDNSATPTPEPSPTPSTGIDPYDGWKTGKSERAKFSIRYPSTWTYSASVGSNDNVEHVRISGASFAINIDSFNGRNTTNGGTSATTCTDCISRSHSEPFTVLKFGSVNLETVVVKLDEASGNALIVRQADGIYLLASPSAADVYSRFRGLSILPTLQAYQGESVAGFTANPDFATASKILKSLTY